MCIRGKNVKLILNEQAQTVQNPKFIPKKQAIFNLKEYFYWNNTTLKWIPLLHFPPTRLLLINFNRRHTRKDETYKPVAKQIPRLLKVTKWK